jgi:hypothetical protein
MPNSITNDDNSLNAAFSFRLSKLVDSSDGGSSHG